MRVLFRVAAALLIAIPLLLVLRDRLRAGGKAPCFSPQLESGDLPLVGERSLGWSFPARGEVIAGVSR